MVVVAITLPMLEDLAKHLESGGTSDVLVEVSVKCRQRLRLTRSMLLALTVANSVVKSRTDSGFELVQRLGLKHCAQSELLDVDFDGVGATVEALMALLRVLKLLLEVRRKVLVLMTSKVRMTAVV